jgi:hypothetical protein
VGPATAGLCTLCRLWHTEPISLATIKEEIGKLSDTERAELALWLDRLDREVWDAEMERDFSPRGPGMKLLEEVDAEIAKGNFKPLV